MTGIAIIPDEQGQFIGEIATVKPELKKAILLPFQ